MRATEQRDPVLLKSIGFGILTACVNLVLMVVKLLTGLAGNSMALVADGIESGGDILISLITWSGFYLSLRPADEQHPFGHGKIEALAGVFSGLSLWGAAGFIAVEALEGIRAPHGSPEWFTLPVLIGVVAVKLGLHRWMMRLEHARESRAVEGDALHHLSDAITSLAAGIGLTVALIGGPDYAMADDVAALLACGVIVYNGLRIMRKSLHDVLDGRVEDHLVERVRGEAMEVPLVRGIDKCLIRKSGLDYFVELHVEVDGDTSVREGHDIGHAVKQHLQRTNPRMRDVVVHLEPEDRWRNRPQ